MQTLIGTFDLTGSDCQLESYDFGSPKLTSDAAAWDYAGLPEFGYLGERHEDAGFEIVAIVRGTSASDVESNLAALLAAFGPGAVLTHTEGEATGSRYTFIRTVSEPRIEEHVGGWARVTLKGTRCPYWFGTQTEVSEATIDAFGTFSVASLPGDVPALTRYYATGPTGNDTIVLSVRETDEGFDWDDTGDSLALSGTYAEVCARTVTTASYAGRFLIAAVVDAAASLRAAVTTGGATVYSPMSVAAEAGTVLLGPITVPATAYTRDFPSTAISIEAKGSGTLTISKWALIPIPSAVDDAAAIVHLSDTMCLDGIPLVAPNVYSYDRTNDAIGASTLNLSTPWGWPMLRPGNNTVFVHFDTTGNGYVSATYIPRYLLPA